MRRKLLRGARVRLPSALRGGWRMESKQLGPRVVPWRKTSMYTGNRPAAHAAGGWAI